MNAPNLLDASAVLAWLHGEPGAEQVADLLQGSSPCLVTAANHAEIIAKLLDRGIAPQAARDILVATGYTVIDTSAADGAEAGWLRKDTRELGLSLGDRLCLAAARRLGARVYTADRPWVQLGAPLNIHIESIRLPV